jgi:hypothetical protein
MSNNNNEILVHVLGIVFIIIVFSLAFAYLKPYRLHKSRKLSTLLLKSSYLLYILILMMVIYMATIDKGGLEEVFMGIEFFAFLIALFVPTVAILARKLGKFSKKREGYNYLFTVINFGATLAIIAMYFI